MNISEPPVDERQPTMPPLFPGYCNLQKLAVAINPDDPPCERTVRNLMDDLGVPYIKPAGERLYDVNAARASILATEVNRKPRGRGRPLKAAP